jgi:hypothetical protein
MAALLLIGCGSEGPTVPVTGTLRYKNAPVVKANVVFMPESGRPATGRTDEQGRFELETFGPGDGAVPGKHVVTVAMAPTGTEPMPLSFVPSNPNYLPDQAEYPIPIKYLSPTQSGLEFTVERGRKNHFEIELVD